MLYRARGVFLCPLLSCALTLAGCGFFASPGKELPAPKPLSPVELFIVQHMPGEPGLVDDPAFGGTVRVVPEQEFFSASGETCRRASVFSPEGEVEVVVMCRDKESGGWIMAPRVWGRGLAPVPAP